MEAKDKKKVKLEFHSTSYMKGMSMKKPARVRPTILFLPLRHSLLFLRYSLLPLWYLFFIKQLRRETRPHTFHMRSQPSRAKPSWQINF
jgi:hypothetical protein